MTKKVIEMTKAVDAIESAESAVEDMSAELAAEFDTPPGEQPVADSAYSRVTSEIDEANNDIQERLTALDEKRREAMNDLKGAMRRVIDIDDERVKLSRIQLQNQLWRLAGNGDVGKIV